jgi:hypothetical protein
MSQSGESKGLFFPYPKTPPFRRTRDLLLPRLISGEVAVAGLEIAMEE